LLLVLTSVVGFLYGPRAAEGKLYDQLASAVGPDTAHTIQNAVAHAHHAGTGTIALVVGIIGMLLGAAAITSQLQNSFDQLLDVVPDPDAGFRRTVYVKLKNILLIILGGVIVLASLVLSGIVASAGAGLQDHIGLPPLLIELLNDTVSLLIMTGLLYTLYRVIPDVVIPRRVLWTTALVVALLFTIGKVVLAFIIGRNGTASAYGAAASLISLLLWVYYGGQILFLGAEGMKIHALNNRLDYRPKRYNVRRTTVHIDGKDVRSRLMEAWIRGYRRTVGKK
jgi:membrane protein